MRKIIIGLIMTFLTALVLKGTVLAQTSPTPTPTTSLTNNPTSPVTKLPFITTTPTNLSPSLQTTTVSPTIPVSITPSPTSPNALPPTVTQPMSVTLTVTPTLISPTSPTSLTSPTNSSTSSNASNNPSSSPTQTPTSTPTLTPLSIKTATIAAETKSLPSILKNLGHLISFPAGFFFHESPQEFYLSDTLPRSQSIALLLIATILFITGMLSLNSELLQAMANKWINMKIAYMVKRGHHSIINIQ